MAALGYRFTIGGRSVVISGDTARCPDLVELARDGDLIVVDACASLPLGNVTPTRRAILERLPEFHASPQDCINMAAMAGVPRVVLTHHLPEASLEFDADDYAGEVIFGNDLDVIVV